MEKFDVTCRTCNTEKSKLMNLSSNAPGSASLSLQDVLFAVCPGVSIADNYRLPQHICYFCSKQLEIAYKFQLQCNKSHGELLQIVQATTLKQEPAQSSSHVQYEDVESKDDNEATLCIEEDTVESLASLNEDLEFLDEDDYMEANDEEEELTEEISEYEESVQNTVDLKPTSSAETEAPIMCCHCDKKFFTLNGLQFHEKLAHKNLQPILTNAEILTIECKYCQQVFETKTELTLHSRYEHRAQLAKDLTCSICQKTFSAKNRYDHHILYHKKDRYQCAVKNCTRNFVIKYKLTDHLKRFHGITVTPSQTRTIKSRVVEEP